MACLNDNYTLHEIALRSEIEMMELNKRKAEGSIMESMIYSWDRSLPAVELLSSHTLHSASRKLDHF